MVQPVWLHVSYNHIATIQCMMHTRRHTWYLKMEDVLNQPETLVCVVKHTKGVVLPHAILNPERKITRAAITENKRLSAVLEHIKAEQDKAPPKVKVKPVSAKNGYVKTGRRPPGGPSKMEPYYARKRAEREARAASQSSDI